MVTLTFNAVYLNLSMPSYAFCKSLHEESKIEYKYPKATGDLKPSQVFLLILICPLESHLNLV
jgi:hypothetical protein